MLAAKPLYHNYLSQNPSGKRSHQALFRLGSIDQSIKSYSTAARFYQILLQRFPRSLLADSVRFGLAVCHYELADYNSAESNFKMVLRLSSDKKIKWKIMIYLAQIDGGRMNYEKAFTKLKQAHDQIENKEIRKQAVVVTEKLINEKLGKNQVSALIQKLGNGFPVDLLLLRKISSHRAEGDITNYMASMEKFIGIFPQPLSQS